MFAFFGTILIVYFLWLVVKPAVARYARRKFQQKVNDMFRQAYGAPSQGMPFGGAADRSTREEDTYHTPRRQRRKIFSREEGEYIEFEELDVRAEYTAADRSQSTYTPREPQVSDAEWEEI